MRPVCDGWGWIICVKDNVRRGCGSPGATPYDRAMADDREPPMLARIGREAGVPELFAVLTRLPGPDLRSLLLHLARAQSAARTPAELLRQHAGDRTVAAGGVDGRRVNELARQALQAAQGFDARELSPVSPVGLQTVLGGIDQMSVLATVRGTEVLADPTTQLALEAAVARREGAPEVRLCAVGRVLRLQPFPVGYDAHFALFSMVTAGRAGNRRTFELAALREHVAVHLRLLANAAPGRATLVGISHASELPQALEKEVVDPLREEFPATAFGLRPDRVEGAAYYRGLMVDIGLADRGGTIHSVADGGATDWTARLLSDRKERMVVTGIGIERVLRVAESG